MQHGHVSRTGDEEGNHIHQYYDQTGNIPCRLLRVSKVKLSGGSQILMMNLNDIPVVRHRS